MTAYNPDIQVDVVGETCPIPLVEMRKAIMKAAKGQVIEVIGTHSASKLEIPMAVESLGLRLVDNFDDDQGRWQLRQECLGGELFVAQRTAYVAVRCRIGRYRYAFLAGRARCDGHGNLHHPESQGPPTRVRGAYVQSTRCRKVYQPLESRD